VLTRSIYFALTRPLIEQVGWHIAADEERETIRVAVNEGSGEDAGFLLLSEDLEKGYAFGTNAGRKGQSMSGGVSVTRFRHYVLNDTTQDIEPEAVEFTVDEEEHTILVQCPDWLRYNPLSVPLEAKPVAPVVKEVVAPVAPVTFHKEKKGQAALASFDELMSERTVEVSPESLNRQARRAMQKSAVNHTLRRK